MSRFTIHPLALAVAAAAAVPATDTQAQDAVAIEEEMIVTGFRRSLQDSLNLKREESSIVEAVSAEDIGKLPDSSIAESLARLPGLAGDRRNGRTSGISVRGFNENYVGTTMNGRELLGMGDNRGVEYDLYPSEIISAAVVYKTPEAGLITQGVGGTVDLRTLRPLDSDRIIAVNANYEQNDLESANPDFDDTGHRLSFTYADQYADDTIGLALAIATTESPSQEEHFRAWGYTDGLIDGHDSFVRSAVLERDTFSGVVQFEPTEALTLTLDALFIDFEETEVKRGLEEVIGGVSSNLVTEEGRVTSGDFAGFHSVIRNDFQREEAELETFGINLEYRFSDTWSLEFDASMGEVTKEITDVETYSGAGRPVPQYVLDGDGNFTFDGDGNPITAPVDRPANARSFAMTGNGIRFGDIAGTPNYADPDLIRLAGPQAWGGNLAPVAAFGPTFVNPDGVPPDLNDQLAGAATAQDGFVNSPVFDEELTTLRLSFEGEVDFGVVTGIEVGVSYSDRKKTKDNDGAFLTAPTWPGDGPIPAQALVGTIDLRHLGDIRILGYDGLGLFDSGYYTVTDAAGDPTGPNRGLETGRLGDSYTVEEELWNVYVQADLATEVGGVNVTGNIGVQIAQADQKSTGWDTSTGEDFFVVATPVSGGDDYTEILPSLNLSFEVADDIYIRTALAKTLSRPRMDDMRPNNQVSFQFNDFNILNTDPQNSAWTGSSGNPELRPLEANQFDLAYEWYFAAEGLVSLTYFYKDLVNWTVAGSTVENFAEFYIPGGFHDATDGSPPATFLGVVTNREDGLEGFVRGQELLFSFPFGLFSDALDGLGLTASATFADGELDDGSRVPGLSEEIYQLTAYYQRGGFEFRISGRKRDDYVSEVRGISLSLVPLVDAGAELWDAQIGYDFADSGIDYLEGLSVTLQAQNLTDEDTEIVDPSDGRLIRQYQSFGANYLLGVNYKF